MMNRAGREPKTQPNRKRESARMTAWRRSAQCRAVALRGLEIANAVLAAMPRCTARSKSTGLQCKKPALRAGKCRCHGGATPRGDQWHRVPIDKPRTEKSFEAVERKLIRRQAEAEQRKRRIDKMSPAERKKYDEWQRTHRAGSAAKRAAARAQKDAANWFRDVVRKADYEREAREFWELFE